MRPHQLLRVIQRLREKREGRLLDQQESLGEGRSPTKNKKKKHSSKGGADFSGKNSKIGYGGKQEKATNGADYADWAKEKYNAFIIEIWSLTDHGGVTYTKDRGTHNTIRIRSL